MSLLKTPLSCVSHVAMCLKYPHRLLGAAPSVNLSSRQVTTYHCSIGRVAGRQITHTSRLIHIQQISGNLNTAGRY